MNIHLKLLRAARFAAEKHTGQHRKGAGKRPYINHPLEVAHLLAEVGDITDHDILVAALLHDTVEDCGVTGDEVKEMFGETVASYVLEVTDDKTLPKPERKQRQIEHAPHLSDGAKAIKLADKISNVRDVIEDPGVDWDMQRRADYVKWGLAVVAGLRGVNEKLEAEFDRIVERANRELV